MHRFFKGARWVVQIITQNVVVVGKVSTKPTNKTMTLSSFLHPQCRPVCIVSIGSIFLPFYSNKTKMTSRKLELLIQLRNGLVVESNVLASGIQGGWLHPSHIIHPLNVIVHTEIHRQGSNFIELFQNNWQKCNKILIPE